MVEGCGILIGGAIPLPIFPDSRCAIFRHYKPAGKLFVFEQLIGIFDADLFEHEEDEGRRQKACAEPPTVVFKRSDEPLSGKVFLLRRQKPHVERAHELCLTVGIERKFGLCDKLPVGALGSLAVLLDAGETLCLGLL